MAGAFPPPPNYLPTPRPSAQAELEFDTLADARAAGFASRLVTIDYRQCTHCRRHFRVCTGSGVRRGWCRRHGVLCGRAACFVCTDRS